MRFLILSLPVPLSSIYTLVNGNFNLKTLKVDFCGEIHLLEGTNIRDLIRILNCDNGLEKLELGCIKGFHRSTTYCINRDEFPRMIQELKIKNFVLTNVLTKAIKNWKWVEIIICLQLFHNKKTVPISWSSICWKREYNFILKYRSEVLVKVLFLNWPDFEL